MTQLSIEKTGESPCIVKHIGSVQDVIQGKISRAITNKKIKASDFAFGFEVATPKEISSLGEAVVVNGQCYVTSTDSSSSDYNKVIHGPEFVPGGLFIIPHGVKPTHLANLPKGADPLFFDDFYQLLYQEISRPFACVGIFSFETFHGIAISKPPINGENIFSNKEKYYENPEIRQKKVNGYVMAVVAKGEDQKKYKLDTVLYQNPLDEKSSLVHHAHALILNRPLEFIDDLTPDCVGQCLHLLNEGTKVNFLEAKIFTIQSVDRFI